MISRRLITSLTVPLGLAFNESDPVDTLLRDPILNQGELSAITYLENNLITREFTIEINSD